MWQAAVCFLGRNAPTQLPLRIDLINKDIDKLLRKFQSDRLEDATLFREYGADRGRLGLQTDFDTLTPLRRTQQLAIATSEGMGRRIFLKAAEKMNIIRAVQGSLRCVASGVRSFVEFCAVMGDYPFPPSEETVRDWIIIFKPGRTYENYIQHLKKAWFLLELDTKWDSQAVRTIANGLENSQGRSFAFPNFIFSKDMIFIMEHEWGLF